METVMAHLFACGGSLAKVVWFSRSHGSPGGRLNFVKFETQNIDECLEFVQNVLSDQLSQIGPSAFKGQLIKATGGGAHKFYDLFTNKLGVHVQREDEMECLITGLNFLVRQIPDEVFTYDDRRPEPMIFETTPREIFPYLVVNIGSGVSILKVTSDDSYERISGTSLGGGTLWGLLSLLTSAKNYDEMLELSKMGDNKNVDMLVGDIYGGDYPKIGLKASTIASSFAKVFKAPKEERKNFREEDISRSLLYLVSNNIGQIAYLNAQAHGIQQIYFSGFFIRGHPIPMNTLNYAVNFWSKGKIKALFLRHEGYLGAVGAFLSHTPRRRLGSFTENFSSISKISGTSLATVGALESMPSNVFPFPLLRDAATYHPDTTDLSDPKLQRYWIDLLEKNLGDLVEMVIDWQGQTESTKSRAATFENLYRDHLQRLRKEPSAYGVLSVRSLLNLREQCLREMGFSDIFEGVKQKENAAAIAVVKKAIEDTDSVADSERLQYITDNILAGNMFDWGANLVQQMLKRGELDFRAAKDKVRFPEKFDHIRTFQERVEKGKAYKKIMIFVDNSGADIVLGIIPFARYFLARQATVVLAANTRPSVNDVTAVELESIIEKVATIDDIINRARESRRLIVVGTGSESPCLDLRRISDDLATQAEGVDLIVIEGMGRAIHTNFFAKFSVDCLKIAVFKNPQVAEELGGEATFLILSLIDERSQYVRRNQNFRSQAVIKRLLHD